MRRWEEEEEGEEEKKGGRIGRERERERRGEERRERGRGRERERERERGGEGGEQEDAFSNWGEGERAHENKTIDKEPKTKKFEAVAKPLLEVTKEDMDAIENATDVASECADAASAEWACQMSRLHRLPLTNEIRAGPFTHAHIHIQLYNDCMYVCMYRCIDAYIYIYVYKPHPHIR